MPLGIKVELSGIDITDKVSRFEITAAMDSYVRELRDVVLVGCRHPGEIPAAQ